VDLSTIKLQCFSQKRSQAIFKPHYGLLADSPLLNETLLAETDFHSFSYKQV